MVVMTARAACRKDQIIADDPSLLPSAYCQQEIFRLVPSGVFRSTLAPAESTTNSIAKYSTGDRNGDAAVAEWGSVKVTDGEAVVAAVNESLLVATRRLPEDRGLLPTCEGADNVTWVSFWAQSPTVDACSNDPK